MWRDDLDAVQYLHAYGVEGSGAAEGSRAEQPPAPPPPTSSRSSAAEVGLRLLDERSG